MTESTSLSFPDVFSALRIIEEELLAPDGMPLSSTVNLAQMSDQIRNAQKLESLDPASVLQLRQTAQRISVISGARIRLEKAFLRLDSSMREDTIRITGQKNTIPSQVKALDLSENLPSYHMRKHFLEHLDNPYPSQEDKESLVQATNASDAQRKKSEERGNELQVHQLTLWFINARRRSGWSNILRKFARNDRQRMRLLMQTQMDACNMTSSHGPSPAVLVHSVDDVLRDNLGRLTDADKKEFEDDWTSMISWLKYGVKEKVGDWVYDIVANSKKPLKAGQPRTVTTAANRTPVRKTAASSKPKRATRRISKTPSVDSDIQSEHESTPELSMCSTADTSFSSFGSNISLLQYDPFQQSDEALLSPTLQAAATRKVKALPKRSQKADSPDEGSSLALAMQTSRLATAPAESALRLTNYPTLPQAASGAQATSAQTQLYPPYDALGRASVPAIRRESLSSNSLSAAFG
nr:homeodomain transcription factor bE [Moesziomyces parantarcticus]